MTAFLPLEFPAASSRARVVLGRSQAPLAARRGHLGGGGGGTGPWPAPRVGQGPAWSAATSTVSAPMREMVVVTSSPGSMGATPAGVPVLMTSPGSRVITDDM